MAKNVLVIGGGLVGLAVAREAAQLPGYEIFLYEKEARLGEHASSRHNGVNHSGIYYPPGSLKAKLCVLGNDMNWHYFPKWNVPCIRTGKYIVAKDAVESVTLEQLLKNGERNGVPGIQHLSGEEVRKDDEYMVHGNIYYRKGEPNVACYSAIFVPTAGIFDGAAYLKRLESLAVQAGVHIAKRTEIVSIERMMGRERSPGGFKVLTREAVTEKQQKTGTQPKKEEALFDIIINAAGTGSAKIAKMVNPDSAYEIVPVRGEGACFYQTREELTVYAPVYPVPREFNLPGGGSTFTVGVHLTSTLQGSELGKMVVVSPLLVNPAHDKDYAIKNPPEAFHALVSSFLPSLRTDDMQPYQSGISAKLKDYRDHLIQRDALFPDCIHLLGFDSPGATSASAAGMVVKSMLHHGYTSAKEYFQSQIPKFSKL